MLVAVNVNKAEEDNELGFKVYDGALNFNNIGDWLDSYALDEKAEPFERKSKKEYKT